jgi:hypothetical protein
MEISSNFAFHTDTQIVNIESFLIDVVGYWIKRQVLSEHASTSFLALADSVAKCFSKTEACTPLLDL